MIFAYSALTGDLLWTTPLPRQYFFSSAPTAANGVVYTGGAGFGGTIYAVRESDGQLLASRDITSGGLVQLPGPFERQRLRLLLLP